jgi:hypothetical protein
MALSSGGGEAAVNFYGFTLGSFPSNRANRDCKQRPRVNAAPSGGPWRGLRCAEAPMNPPDREARALGVAAPEPLGGLACTG